MEKNSITTVQMNLCCLLPILLGFDTKYSTELLSLKFLPLVYHHNHPLAATFLQWHSWGPHTFLQLKFYIFLELHTVQLGLILLTDLSFLPSKVYPVSMTTYWCRFLQAIYFYQQILILYFLPHH